MQRLVPLNQKTKHPNANIKVPALIFCNGWWYSLSCSHTIGNTVDGDVLNVYYIINKAFYKRANQVINPRKSMYISNNDGKLNGAIIPARDTLINANTLINLSRKYYNSSDIETLKKINN